MAGNKYNLAFRERVIIRKESNKKKLPPSTQLTSEFISNNQAI